MEQLSVKSGVNCGSDVGRMVNVVSNQIKRHFTLPGEEQDLTAIQRRVLHFIILSSGSHEVYQKDLEAEFNIRRSSATGMLKLLEKKGFILRESVERDGRLKRVLPTKKALDLRKQMLNDIENLEKKLSEHIEPADLDVCLKVLNQMSKNLSKEERECRTWCCRPSAPLQMDETEKKGRKR